MLWIFCFEPQKKNDLSQGIFVELIGPTHWWLTVLIIDVIIIITNSLKVIGALIASFFTNFSVEF